ncbi:ribosome assembly protein 4 (RSA4) [Reticulomyxa filosa]|uniref:Ribosome assembly protein 4 (RSA4) n=1 Tax=Reticulomyxa filosa TaxID=46433 RepID=X6N5G7_RETFI|nr:ribosome assembly protein 4 (RSA4) [Reticulomyxa filosa]|eukprot:ETO21183.1 ribosome assembly protein 4 (RSA4) [Reticulomyxa filosa]
MEEEITLKDKKLLEKEEEIQKIKRELSQIREGSSTNKEQIPKQDKPTSPKETKAENMNDEKKEPSTPGSSEYSTFILNMLHSFGLQKTFSGHKKCVESIDYSIFDEGRFLCSGSSDKTVRIWDTNTAKQLKIFDGHSASVYCVKFSPYHYHNYHQKVIGFASGDKTICLWDFETTKVQALNGHDRAVRCIQFSPFNGGQYLCSGSDDNTICLWDTATHKSLNVFKAHTLGVWCVEFSPLQSANNKNVGAGIIGGTGYTLCSGSADNTIRLWDVETGKESIIFKGNTSTVRSVKYEPYGIGINGGGNAICSGSDDATVRLWDIRSGQANKIFKGHGSRVTCVEYLPFISSNISNIRVAGGNIICSGSVDKSICFWDIRNDKQLHKINNEISIFCLQFHPLNTMNTKKSHKEFTLCYGGGKGRIQFRRLICD